MKRTLLVLLSALCAAPLLADAGPHVIPAGSLIGCTLSEPKLSSKTAAIGDPVLCQLGHAERYGRSVLPLNSYLVGRFEDYKDPGHFVGKGWMQLKFDRMVIEPDTVIPVDARVVDVPGYRVDNQGRILGKGHATRDAVLWSIPVLWPADLVMLPMRGPRPVLKEETHLTLKVMDDLEVPATQQPQQDPYGLMRREPVAEDLPPQNPYPDQEQPQMADAAPAPDAYPTYAAPPPPPPVYAYAPPIVAPPPVVAYVPGGVGFGVGVYGYGARAYAPGARRYGYAPGYRGYGYAGGPRIAPRGYGNGYGARPYSYGAAPRVAGYGGGRGFARVGGGAGFAGRR